MHHAMNMGAVMVAWRPDNIPQNTQTQRKSMWLKSTLNWFG